MLPPSPKNYLGSTTLVSLAEGFIDLSKKCPGLTEFPFGWLDEIEGALIENLPLKMGILVHNDSLF